eukprot:Opistho-2@89399
MALVGDHLWRAVVHVDAVGAAEFKFDVAMDWVTCFGDDNGDGRADAHGANIRFERADGDGLFEITFNDQTLVYTVRPAASPAPPLLFAAAAHLEATVVAAGANSLHISLVFNGIPEGATVDTLLDYYKVHLPDALSAALGGSASLASRFKVVLVTFSGDVGDYIVDVHIKEAADALDPTASTLYSRIFTMYLDKNSTLWSTSPTSLLSTFRSPYPTDRGECSGSNCKAVSGTTNRNWIIGGTVGFCGAVAVGGLIFYLNKGRKKNTRHELTRPLLHE